MALDETSAFHQKKISAKPEGDIKFLDISVLLIVLSSISETVLQVVALYSSIINLAPTPKWCVCVCFPQLTTVVGLQLMK